MSIYDTPQWPLLKPFFDERDWFDGEEAGLPIAMRRNHSKSWCGYVGVPEGHPLFRKTYYDRVAVSSRGAVAIKQQSPMSVFIEAFHEDDGQIALDMFLDAPGGITFTDKAWWTEDAYWYFGFDCNHYNDLSPQDIISSFGGYPYDIADPSRIYRTFDWVQSATRALAQQIAGIFK